MTSASPVLAPDQAAGPDFRTAMWTALIAAAVEVGRMPGEPPVILELSARPTLMARLTGTRQRGPLADPRLEVLRAISASLTAGVVQVREDLLAAAYRAGWTVDDLRRALPGHAVARPLERH